jgi:putative two-component system response regulator
MVRRVEETIAVLGKDETAAMLLFDLDGFKQVNDHFGHLFGDEVLQQAAGRFLQTVPGGDIVARVGGDEFLVFLRELPDPEAARLCAEQISGALNDAFGRMMTECRPSCSVGIAMCPGDGTDFNTLFRCSDIALYRAKGAGKDCIELYDAETMGNDFSWRTSEPITEPTQ